MIPTNFNDWKRCIEIDCKIKLNEDFARQRLKIYQDNNNQESLKFIQLYGEQHLNNIVQWYKKIVNDGNN
jgi:hypothetical protein